MVEEEHHALRTLTSGQKREVRGGALQAHICTAATLRDVQMVMEAFRIAAGFQSVASWAYAWRPPHMPEVTGGEQPPCVTEVWEDGLDEGSGQKILGVLKRHALEGMLLVVSRWQDYGADPGLELFGTALYSMVVERCKDLINNLKKAIGMQEAQLQLPSTAQHWAPEAKPPPPQRRNFDFSFLPKLPEPRVQTKFGPNHFLAGTTLNRPASLPQLFSGGDVQMWMVNDHYLQLLPESELWTLRSLRQPDPRLERVLHAVALLRGHPLPPKLGFTPAARWGTLLQVLRSPTLRTELLLFDASQVPLETALMVEELLAGLEAGEVRRANLGACALFEWAQGAVRWRLEMAESGRDSAGASAEDVQVQPLPQRQASLEGTSCSTDGERRRGASCGMRRRAGNPRTLAQAGRSRSSALLGMSLTS